jgi:putative transferase (TIGR04331 family)
MLVSSQKNFLSLDENKYCLVTTADERTWPKDKSVLFLGEWCKLFSRKDKWSKLNFKTVSYHWDDRGKLSRDYSYLQDLYEILLQDLSGQLNEIHNVNHSVRYWRILIGPWLGYFIQMLFDRWSMLNKAVKEYDIDACQVLNRNVKSIVPNDMTDFVRLFDNDDWNEAIYGQLLSGHLKHNMVVTSVNTKSACQSSVSMEIEPLSEKLKRFFKIFTTKISGVLTRENDYFFISSYFSLSTLFALQFRLRQFPSFWSAIQMDYCNVDLRRRQWQLTTPESLDDFPIIVRKLIPKHIPIAYLEGYKELIEFTEKLPWPRKPKAIFTSNSYSKYDIFKAWAAKKTETGSVLVIGQHGGHFGMTPWGFDEWHQISIANNFLSWGWEDSKRSKIIPIGNNRIVKRQAKCNPNGGALLVGLIMSRYSNSLYSAPISSQWLSYFEDQCDFINFLPIELQSQVKVRLASYDYGWDQELRWRERFSNVILDPGNQPIKNIIGQSRLYISTYNATTYLESLFLNVPTIIFWNPDHWELNKETESYFQLLMDVGIFHRTPYGAAQKVIEVWDNVDAWWMSKNTQSARLFFCEKYTKEIKHPVNELESFIVNKLK